MSSQFSETNHDEPVEYPPAPLYGGEERSPYLPAKNPNAPKPTLGGESSEFEPSEVIVPTKPDQNQVEAATPSTVWDTIDRARSDETRSGRPVAKMSSAAIKNAFTSLDKK